ncbi:hypothetical protein DFH27DRAFT_553859, partial [Peziza echinospora]
MVTQHSSTTIEPPMPVRNYSVVLPNSNPRPPPSPPHAPGLPACWEETTPHKQRQGQARAGPGCSLDSVIAEAAGPQRLPPPLHHQQAILPPTTSTTGSHRRPTPDTKNGRRQAHPAVLPFPTTLASKQTNVCCSSNRDPPIAGSRASAACLTELQLARAEPARRRSGPSAKRGGGGWN